MELYARIPLVLLQREQVNFTVKRTEHFMQVNCYLLGSGVLHSAKSCRVNSATHDSACE